MKLTKANLALMICAGVLVVAVIVLGVVLLQDREPQGETKPPVSETKAPETTPPETTAPETVPNAELPTEPEPSGEAVQPAFPVEVREDGDVVRVITEFGELSYPMAFADVIRIETAKTDTASTLKFMGQLADGQEQLFDVIYGEGEGSQIKRIVQQDGTEIGVFLKTYDPPQNLSENDLNTFYAAQEVLNDIISALFAE